MKELSIEEKAKRYDVALTKARNIVNSINVGLIGKDSFEAVFPELAELEGERIRIELLDYLYDVHDDDEERARWLAWLEAQGEHANFRNKIQIGDKVTRNEDGVLVNLSQLNRVAKKDEKQDEQKPAELSENRSKELSLSLQIQAYLNIASDELYAKGKPLYSEKRLEDIHKCMLMWQKLHNAYFYQKSVWSEEDNRLINEVIELIDAGSLDREEKDYYIERLKSLRPQSYWKPSEKFKCGDLV